MSRPALGLTQGQVTGVWHLRGPTVTMGKGTGFAEGGSTALADGATTTGILKDLPNPGLDKPT